MSKSIQPKHDISIKINSESELQKLCCLLGDINYSGLVIYLMGGLGVGKTAFARCLINSLGYSGLVKSPTYTIVETYHINLLTVNHFDLYRLTSAADLHDIGVYDYFDRKSLSIIEWPEYGFGVIPASDIELHIEYLDDDSRNFDVFVKSQQGTYFLEKIKQICE